jgi:excisionase family DNA binding protein
MPDEVPQQKIDRPNIEDLIPLEEAARLSGFTDRHIRKLATNNEIWAVRLGRNWFTTSQAVNDYLTKKHKPGPRPKKAII